MTSVLKNKTLIKDPKNRFCWHVDYLKANMKQKPPISIFD